MPMLGFLPWIAFDNSMAIGPFSFVPYVRGRAPFGIDSPAQKTADLLLEPYRTLQGRSVRDAVLVQVTGREPFDELLDEEAQALFEAVELLAFAALACRDYFNFNSITYCNRDHFAFYLQQFQDPGGGAGVLTRRRDGHTRKILPREVYRVVMPDYVYPLRPTIDHALLSALWTSRGSASWEHFFEAILGFNQANTDSNQVPEQSEAVALVGAFERLYDIRTASKREHALVEAVLPDLQWRPQLGCEACGRAGVSVEKTAVALGPTEEWLRDFFRSRGGWAHGRRDPTHPAIWTRWEHLLLGAFVFPLVLKGKLRREYGYEPSADDHLRLSVLDHLVCIENLLVADDPVADDEHPWRTVMCQGRIQQLVEAIKWEVLDPPVAGEAALSEADKPMLSADGRDSGHVGSDGGDQDSRAG